MPDDSHAVSTNANAAERVLATLEREGFLWRGADGQYAMRAGH